MTQPQAASADRPRISPYSRTLLSARWWHNWINVFIGVIIALWVVSGVIMLLPLSETARAGQGTGRPIGWSTVTVSPAQATQAALAGTTDRQVAGVSLQRLRDGMIYQVRIQRSAPVLVDAATGRIVTIDDSLAVAIARDAVPSAPVAHVERVERPGGGYTGSLPAWHVAFRDHAQTESWVSVQTGDVRRSEHSDRIKAFWGYSAHVFRPLKEGPGGERSRLGALWITSLISMVSILTGYWLALPRRWRSRFV